MGDSAAAASASVSASAVAVATRGGLGLRLRLLPEKCVEANRGKLPEMVRVDQVPAVLGRAPGLPDPAEQRQGKDASGAGTGAGGGSNGGAPAPIVVIGVGISRQHLRFLPPSAAQQAAGVVLLVVDESSQGVAVDKQRIPRGEPRPLRPGQVISLGLSRAQSVPAGQNMGRALAGAAYCLERVPLRGQEPVVDVEEDEDEDKEEDVDEVEVAEVGGAAGSARGGPWQGGRRRGAPMDDSSDDEEVEIVGVQRGVKRPRRQGQGRGRVSEVVSLLDDDESQERLGAAASAASAAAAAAGPVVVVNGRGVPSSSSAAASVSTSAGMVAAAVRAPPPAARGASAAAASAGDGSSRLMEGLSCPVCFELIATACHLSCSHAVCFTCVHRFWVQAANEDGSVLGFGMRDRRRECPQCRASIQRVARTCMIDTMAEAFSGALKVESPEDHAEWQDKCRDGLALAQWYESRLGGNPFKLALKVGKLTIKVFTRVAEEGLVAVVCPACRDPIEPGTYEAEWSGAGGNHAAAAIPQPSSGLCHLGCLRAQVCQAVRATLKPEDLLSLCFRVEVQSVLAAEMPPPEQAGAGAGAGPYEGFKRGPLARALSQVGFPWWVYGELEIKSSKKRGMRILGTIPEVPAAALAAAAAGGAQGTPSAPHRMRTRLSPGTG